MSHGHLSVVKRLLHRLSETHDGLVEHCVVTHNVPDAVLARPSAGWPFRFTELFNPAPLGFGANHNQAFQHCTTDYFCVLNPDIELIGAGLWTSLLREAGRPGTGLAYPRLLNPDGGFQDNEREAVTPAALLRRHLLKRPQRRVDWISGAFWVVPTQVYRRLGGFDERFFMYCEDTDFCLRLQLAGLALRRADVSVIHEARRDSRSPGRQLGWHLRSLLRLWSGPVLRRYLANSPASIAQKCSIECNRAGQSMKILHVYKSYYPDTVGGIEQVIAQLGLGLVALGHESRIYTLSPDPRPPVLKRPEGEVHRSRTTLEIASMTVSIRALTEFRRQLEWADVVHYQFPWPFADLLHLLWARNKPSVVSYQSDIVRQKWLLKAYTPLMNRFLDSVGMVVATSPPYSETSTVLSRLRTPIRVIPNGLDESSYAEPSPEAMARWRARVGEGFFLFVGVLRYYKGLHTLLEAAKGFEGTVVIAGTGPESERIQQQVAEDAVGNVQLLGHVSDEDKVCLLRLCRGFVFPSHLRSEAFGMSLVEAAMLGKPMISCDIGTGTSYVNLDGVTGWTVPGDDATRLREAMQRLLSSQTQAQAMGQAARRRFESLFTAARMAAEYEAVYRAVVAAR